MSNDPALASRVRSRPGLRVPGAWDPFELAVRAVLGQQVSVRAATTFAGRLVTAVGRPLPKSEGVEDDAPRMSFPLPAALAKADLGSIGLTSARIATLKALGTAVAVEPHLLRSRETLDETVAALSALPGLGPWTAQYIAMRALREPDAFPASDLGLLRAMATKDGRPTPKALAEHAERWRPWRAYAALRLWTQYSVADEEPRRG
jgi:AraC family transcriptional regulator of adaptative response / DNA-3-methyladenine glycosylase II